LFDLRFFAKSGFASGFARFAALFFRDLFLLAGRDFFPMPLPFGSIARPFLRGLATSGMTQALSFPPTFSFLRFRSPFSPLSSFGHRQSFFPFMGECTLVFFLVRGASRNFSTEACSTTRLVA